MPRTLPASFILEKNKLYNENPWLMLIELQVSSTSSFYLTNSMTSITSNGDVFDPYPITLDKIPSSDEGDLTNVRITISNITRELMTYVEESDGLVGKTLLLQIFNAANLNDTYSEKLEVFSSGCTVGSIEIEASYFMLETATFPGAFFVRDYCMWEFGSAECGVDTSNINIFNPSVDSTCTKRKSGNFGCIFWGTRESSAGVTVNHPKRYGGFPSIPRGLVLNV